MQDQAEENYLWFKSRRAGLAASNKGRHALLHNQGVVAYFGSSLEAIKAGFSRHGEGNFSVEPVDDITEDLGFYSHVSATLRA